MPTLSPAVPAFKTAMDSFPRASFTPDGGSKIEFAYSKIRYEGGQRNHMHEYLHADGGKLEKQGRKPKRVVYEGIFYEGFNPSYPNLYPKNLTQLIDLIDGGVSGIISVPGVIGSLHATGTEYSGEIDVKLRSGETISLTFTQDDQTAFELDRVLGPSASSLSSLSSTLNIAADAMPAPPSLFDQIQTAVNKVLAIQDQADLFAMTLESKIAYVSSLCHQADNLLEMRDPAADNVLQALHDLWAAANQSILDIQAKRSPLQTYVCPRDMSAGDVAGDSRVYGDASRSQDIIQINPTIDDPFRIPAGTKLQFYPDSSVVRAANGG